MVIQCLGVMGGAYRKKRQKGYGGAPIRKKRQRGYGGGAQRGKGPKWDKFKARLKRGWHWIKPKLVEAGKQTIPEVAAMAPHNAGMQRREAVKVIGKRFGKNLLASLSR